VGIILGKDEQERFGWMGKQKDNRQREADRQKEASRQRVQAERVQAEREQTQKDREIAGMDRKGGKDKQRWT
jgi:hypothetical protein